MEGIKWRCKICNQTHPRSEGDEKQQEAHVKFHKGIIAGFRETTDMDWKKYIEIVGEVSSTFGSTAST